MSEQNKTARYLAMACRHWPPDAVIEVCPVQQPRSLLRTIAPLAVSALLAALVYLWPTGPIELPPGPTPPAYPRIP